MEIKFECTKCGDCCRGGVTGPILTEDESEVVEGLLGKEAIDGEYMKLVNGACIALVQNRCMIHADRPMQCRSFPFWAAFWDKPGRWRLARCEGLEVTDGPN